MTKQTIYWALGLGGALLGWILFKRRGGESTASATGRVIGEGAIGLVGGAIGGVYDAGMGAVESAAGVRPFQLRPVPARVFYPDKNLQRLQGSLASLDGGAYRVEVQNNSDVTLKGVRVELVVDKLGLDPVTEFLGEYTLPPHSGVGGEGVILIRSITGILPITAKLYANKFLMARVD